MPGISRRSMPLPSRPITIALTSHSLYPAAPPTPTDPQPLSRAPPPALLQEMSRSLAVAVTILVLCASASAFAPASLGLHSSRLSSQICRRDAVAAVLSSPLLVALPRASLASGGATAGGAYLLSAKQRYNERVIKGSKLLRSVTGKDDVSSALPNPRQPQPLTDFASLAAQEFRKQFMKSEDWEDFKAAGYLLGNAFRRNSQQQPDSLPAVKNWKAFQAALEKLAKGKGAIDWSEPRFLLDQYVRAKRGGQGDLQQKPSLAAVPHALSSTRAGSHTSPPTNSSFLLASLAGTWRRLGCPSLASCEECAL